MGKDAMDWEESADFLAAAERLGPRAHVIACLTTLHGLSVEAICATSVDDLSAEEDVHILRISVLPGAPRVPVRLTPRTADALNTSIGPRAAGPMLLDDDGSPLRPPAARRVVNAAARSAGLGHRLDPRSDR